MTYAKYGKVFICEDRHPIEPIVIRSSDWLNIEGRLGVRLMPTTRKKLLDATNLYAASLRPKETMKSLKDIETLLDKWRRQTDVTRNNIWSKDHKKLARDKKEIARFVAAFQRNDYMFEADLENVLDHFFHKGQSQVEFRRPAALLDRFLKGSVVLNELFKTILTEEAKASQEHRLWLLWASLIFAILRQAGIRVQHPKKKQLRCEPVAVLCRLQAKLPGELQRRKTDDSLRKGAVIAWKVRKGIEPQQLMLLLRRWAKADYRRRHLMGYEAQITGRMAQLAEHDSAES